MTVNLAPRISPCGGIRASPRAIAANDPAPKTAVITATVIFEKDKDILSIQRDRQHAFIERRRVTVTGLDSLVLQVATVDPVSGPCLWLTVIAQ